MRNDKMYVKCDWLQFHGHHLGHLDSGIEKRSNFKIKSLGRGTRVFKEVLEVYEKANITPSHRDELIATICVQPHSKILRPNMFLCKIENKVLYQRDTYARVCRMIDQLQLQYEGITRFDVCCDLQKFANNMHPLELLKLYRKNKLIKHGSRSYSQWLTAPFTPNQLQGDITADMLSDEHITHCISWGGATSDVHVKMYNKTKEIKEASGKQYIAAWHRALGFSRDADVWRVEISVTRRSKYLFDNSAGEVAPITLEWACKEAYAKEVFMAYARRHFRFRVAEVGKYTRTMPDVDLFYFSDCEVMKTAAPESKPIAGRTAKVCANYLEQLARSTDFDLVLPKCPYSRQIIEAAHDTLVQLHEGLKALSLPLSKEEQPSRKELQEKADWLYQWNVLPIEIEGVKVWEIDDLYTDFERRNLMMEEMALRKKELENYMQFVAMYENY